MLVGALSDGSSGGTTGRPGNALEVLAVICIFSVKFVVVFEVMLLW